jgi:hypothetical protein
VNNGRLTGFELAGSNHFIEMKQDGRPAAVAGVDAAKFSLLVGLICLVGQNRVQVDEILRRDPGYHTCPLGEDFAAGADIAAVARIPFPAHRHSVAAAHRRVAAERDNNTDLGP